MRKNCNTGIKKKQKHPHPGRIKKAFKGIDIKRLVKALGSTDNTFSQVVNGLIVVSPLRARQIERLTGGQVKAEVLRPDIFSTSRNGVNAKH